VGLPLFLGQAFALAAQSGVLLGHGVAADIRAAFLEECQVDAGGAFLTRGGQARGVLTFTTQQGASGLGGNVGITAGGASGAPSGLPFPPLRGAETRSAPLRSATGKTTGRTTESFFYCMRPLTFAPHVCSLTLFNNPVLISSS